MLPWRDERGTMAEVAPYKAPCDGAQREPPPPNVVTFTFIFIFSILSIMQNWQNFLKAITQ